jgi:hypothetical protein
MAAINYQPPQTVRDFITHYLKNKLFYSWIVGPVGSGKTTGLFFKLVNLAMLQEPGPDGIRRTRAVVVRNTLPQLRDTTISSWNYWFKDGESGFWMASQNKFELHIKDPKHPAICEVLFRPLDTADDVARVLSLEITFALIDEFVQIPRAIVDALSARVGRYPPKKDGGATNFGIFGASNPDLETNWWYDYLHKDLPSNAKFFVQPSGLSPEAENLENLPPNYYDSAVQGKTPEWVSQFVECHWGFSQDGKPVVSTFKPELHIAKKPLLYNPHLPLVFGFDPGIGGTAAVFGQQDLKGRLLILGEVTAEGFGTQRFIEEKLRPYIRRKFPDANMDNIICAPDPAAGNRSQTDERAVVDVLRRHFAVKIETDNRLARRLDAIDHFTARLVEGEPALLIDQECKEIIRAWRGAWRWVLDPKKDIFKSPEPEKNAASHVADAGGYLARFFHKQSEREMRYGTSNRRPFTPPKFTGNGYHYR